MHEMLDNVLMKETYSLCTFVHMDRKKKKLVEKRGIFNEIPYTLLQFCDLRGALNT